MDQIPMDQIMDHLESEDHALVHAAQQFEEHAGRQDECLLPSVAQGMPSMDPASDTQGSAIGPTSAAPVPGCRFSRIVCQYDEQCIDDNLFGSCQKVEGIQEQDLYRYHLDRGTLRLLEREITRLVGDGYTWTSLYTQCIVGNILLAFRLQVQPDMSWCDDGGAPPARYQEALTDDSRTILADYINDYYNDHPAPVDEDLEEDFVNPSSYDVVDVDPYTPPVEKKDEFVTIHKYLADKRNRAARGEEDLGEDAVYDDPFREPSLGYEPDVSSEGLGENMNELLDELRPSDLVLLESYLRDMDRDDLGLKAEEPALEREEETEIHESGPSMAEEREVAMEMMEPPRSLDDPVVQDGEEGEASRGYVWDDRMDGKMPIAQPGEALESEMLGSNGGDYFIQQLPSEDQQEELPSLSPPDAKLLGDLLQDKVDMDSLTDGQIQRLLNHVDMMLYDMQGMRARQDDDQPQGAKLEDPDEIERELQNKRTDDGPMIVETVSEPTVDDEEEDMPDPHDKSFNQQMQNAHTDPPKLAVLNTLQGYMHVSPAITSEAKATDFLIEVENVLSLPHGSLVIYSVKDGDLVFDVSKDSGMDAQMVAAQAMKKTDQLQNRTGLTLEDAGVGDDRDKLSVTSEATAHNGPKYFVLTFVLCGSIAGIVLAVIALYIVKRHSRSKDKLKALASTADGNEASKDYQDLCRQRMQSKTSEKAEVHQGTATRVSSVASESAVRSPSSRSSTSSWSEEPVASNMDISTGHIVLSYMEDHLKNKDRLSEEWEALCAYEAEPSTTTVGSESSNMRKNRYSDVLPYDHSRVILSSTPNVSGSDYVNANTITDHDPRNPAYIATQGPLPHTVADFWQMVWEQGSVVIVCLSKLTENGVAMCHRYWPEEGSDLYHIYEVHLVSEHIWCDDYLVRSFYLKNLQTNETRTVTQFHFLTWSDLGVPTSAKALLDFRRKVNKSYRGRSCPIVVHCSDGVGRTGTYCLIDMVLNRMSKGAKEIDIAATLEHIRDQRANTVKTKEQFEFALASVAEEVHAILKALPQ